MFAQISHERSQALLRQRNLFALSSAGLAIALVVAGGFAVTREREVVLVPTTRAPLTVSSAGVTAQYLEFVTRDAALMLLNRSPEGLDYWMSQILELADPAANGTLKGELMRIVEEQRGSDDGRGADIDKLHALIANAPRREDFPPFLTAAQRRRRHWWGLGADCCYIVIKAGLYLMACWVIAMGLPLMFLLLLTGGQMDKVLVFLGSLFGAFADATPDRQYAFASQANWVLVALATAVAAWRLPRFLDEVSEGLKTTRKMS